MFANVSAVQEFAYTQTGCGSLSETQDSTSVVVLLATMRTAVKLPSLLHLTSLFAISSDAALVRLIFESITRRGGWGKMDNLHICGLVPSNYSLFGCPFVVLFQGSRTEPFGGVGSLQALSPGSH